MPFRASRRRERDSDISRFMEDTNHDMMNLTKNLREEMKLARKLSFRRIDQAVSSLKKPPPGQIQYPQIEDESSSSSLACALQGYPTLDEVSRLPSSRHLSQILDEESDDDTDKKPPATATIHEEEELPATSAAIDDRENDHRTSTNDVKIEVFPGVFKRLRGSKETQDAWEHGLCAQAPCMVCDADLAFVWDCEFVICPNCKAVVPVDVTESGLSESMPSLQSSISSFLSESETFADLPRQGGVGLGIRIL